MNIIDLVRECINEGNFTLSNGERSTRLCDLLLAIDDLHKLHLDYLIPAYGGSVFGVEFGGALIAYTCFKNHGIVRKDGTVYKPEIYKLVAATKRPILLLDDVVTTEKTMRKAETVLENFLGERVSSRWCILDRRDTSIRDNYIINSLVK